ncbi:hypothetical protein M405DRAFT_862631 [Rhizopogon salebrosus TDB-379]|nr:hypothetical protein M405DRAFT_862631 [Rhizopogon salebrosus TDB-379]
MLKDTNSNMDRYFDDENTCGIEGSSTPDAIGCGRLREIDCTQLVLGGNLTQRRQSHRCLSDLIDDAPVLYEESSDDLPSYGAYGKIPDLENK